MFFKSIIFVPALSLAVAASTPVFAKSEGMSSGFEAVQTTIERVGTQARETFALERDGMSGMRSDGGAVRMKGARKTKSRLTPATKQSCDRKRSTFFRKHFDWLRKHTHNRGVSFTSKVSKNRDHYEVFAPMFKPYEGQKYGNAYLAPDQSLYESYTDPKLDIRQRVQWTVLFSQLIKDKTAEHEENYQDFDIGYSLLVLAQARCEIIYDNSLAIEKYLKDNDLEAETDKEARVLALNHAMQ